MKLQEVIKYYFINKYLGLKSKSIRAGDPIPKKHWKKLDKLFLIEIPQSWKNYKKTNTIKNLTLIIMLMLTGCYLE